jgi:hypothetical protein
MRRTIYHPTTKPHPLESLVVSIAKRVGKLDGTKLAMELSGCSVFRGPRAKSGTPAYHIVAEDVLGYLGSLPPRGVISVHRGGGLHRRTPWAGAQKCKVQLWIIGYTYQAGRVRCGTRLGGTPSRGSAG